MIFVDTSALVALFLKDDDFHKKAKDFIVGASDTFFVSSNFILDEVYTFIRARKGLSVALKFINFLGKIGDLKIVRVSIGDEQKALSFFKKLPGRGASFTDCTSFAVMKRLGVKKAFTFDRDFEKAGFQVLP